MINKKGRSKHQKQMQNKTPKIKKKDKEQIQMAKTKEK